MKKLANTFGIVRWYDWHSWGVVFSLFASLYHSPAQGTFTGITFDGPPAFVGSVLVTGYSELGMSFTAITNQQGYGGFARIPARWADYPYNGTAYVHTVATYPVEITATSGLPFSLLAVDLAEYSRSLPNAAMVQFIGYLADGSAVTTSFTTDGIIGVPGVPDFQTFTFGPEFTMLTRVVIPGAQASLDNLYVYLIPEPGTVALLILGAVLLTALGLRRSRAKP